MAALEGVGPGTAGIAIAVVMTLALGTADIATATPIHVSPPIPSSLAAEAEGSIAIGPVLSGTRAIWPEVLAGTLSLRSLNGAGQEKTVWSQTGAAGVPANVVPELSVPSIAAGSGRVAFVRDAWLPSGGDAYEPPASSTLFAGRPGSIRALRTIGGPCAPPPAPQAVAVSGIGIVSYEARFLCSPQRPKAELVLRSFSGRLLRVLQRGAPLYSLSAAGHWAAWLEGVGRSLVFRLYDLRSGSLALSWHEPRDATTVAVDRRGDFAIASRGAPVRCLTPAAHSLGTICVGSGSPGRLRLVTRRAASPYLALFGGSVAFAGIASECPLKLESVLVFGRGPILCNRLPPGFEALRAIAYDGRALAISDGRRVWLETLR